MQPIKSVPDWLVERGLSQSELVDRTGLDKRVVEAIIHGRYTPSPDQRGRIAAVLGVSSEQIAWGHVAQVEHVYGHGPQFGRSP
jgi:transcriptional regulator with XRE-family HTH domain